MLLRIALIMVCLTLMPIHQACAQTTEEKVRIDNTDYPIIYLAKPELEGDAIWLLQARLRDLGYDTEANGKYDENTKEKVELFQVANDMDVTGVVNESVWEKIMYDPENEPCLADQQTDKKVRIEIELDKHKLTLYENNQPIKSYQIGIGKSSTHSPLGEWKVAQKAVGWGNGFGSRWMGLNVAWGVYGIHGTDKPWSVGRSESHGCIRMRNKDVEDLFPLVPIGTRVRIMENGQIFPSDFVGRTLKKRSSGKSVVYLQNRLKDLGIPFQDADGRYGNMTEFSVKYYQVWHGLNPTGIADEETFRSMGMIK